MEFREGIWFSDRKAAYDFIKCFAKMHFLNASHLSVQFKKETGMTFTDYVNQKRIQTSIPLLNATDLLIKDISWQVGFENENYYSRVFKRLQGVTPMEYRKAFHNLS
ncbi:MAG: helix-turn-helix transcriptional regulator [Clostridiales bacterium]|nr:helix-turn-helix transcriptional regulator [Clostridiales bacterium]